MTVDLSAKIHYSGRICRAYAKYWETTDKCGTVLYVNAVTLADALSLPRVSRWQREHWSAAVYSSSSKPVGARKQASRAGKEWRRYQEAASIQLLPSPVLGLPSTSSTVNLLLFMQARLAVVAKTCMYSTVSAAFTTQSPPRNFTCENGIDSQWH